MQMQDLREELDEILERCVAKTPFFVSTSRPKPVLVAVDRQNALELYRFTFCLCLCPEPVLAKSERLEYRNELNNLNSKVYIKIEKEKLS